MTTLPPPAMIIAGGSGRRMGGAVKALLPLGGARVIDHLRAALAPQVGMLAVNTNDPAAWAGCDLPVLPDTVPDRLGPLAGLLAALLWARGLGVSRVLTVPGDTPFLPADLVARLALPGGAAIAEAPEASGEMRLHPLCGLWPVALAEPLAGALASGERRVARWAETAGAVVVPFAPAVPPAFFNLNTPHDLAQAEDWLRRG